MSTAGACLSTSIFAAVALLGRPYMQIMVSGQAAVGVVVSTVQLVSAAISVWGTSPEAIATFIADGGIGEGVAEQRAARMFFGVSVLFMASTSVAHLWLTRQPVYKETVGHADMHKHQDTIEDTEEDYGFITIGSGASPSDSVSDVLRVFKANFVFMFSVGYIFAVTLVRTPNCYVNLVLIFLARLYTLLSRLRCYRQIRMCIPFSLPPFISWHSM